MIPLRRRHDHFPIPYHHIHRQTQSVPNSTNVPQNPVHSSLSEKDIYTVDFSVNTTDQLFKITEQMIKDGKNPLNEYDGPVYLRASEAEEKRTES